METIINDREEGNKHQKKEKKKKKENQWTAMAIHLR